MRHLETLRFCSLAELRAKRRVTKWVDDWRDEISAFSVNSEIVVISSICPHFGGEFDQPDEKGIVRCKWHGWRFDTFTGKCLTYRTATSLRRYSHRERDGDLEILREIGGANDAS